MTDPSPDPLRLFRQVLNDPSFDLKPIDPGAEISDQLDRLGALFDLEANLSALLTVACELHGNMAITLREMHPEATGNLVIGRHVYRFEPRAVVASQPGLEDCELDDERIDVHLASRAKTREKVHRLIASTLDAAEHTN